MTCLVIAEARGRFLFEIRPDVFPQGYLTDQELMLWDRYYTDKKRDRNARP